MKDIVEGLVYLHDVKKIVHRDLKPENILIMNGSAKISDLGTAKSIKSSSLSSVVGAHTYKAPEIF
jgi:serine/threonine protein kinase